MGKDRITELRIDGLRSIEHLELPLDGLAVLIGDNGSGKSSILEAAEILRRASSQQFYSEFHDIHGGLFDLLRRGSANLHLGVTIDGAGPPLRYDITLAREGQGAIVVEERMEIVPTPGEEWLPMIDRTREQARIITPAMASLKPIAIRPDRLVLPAVTGPLSPHQEFARLQRALEEIEVHVPFEVTPSWVAAAHGRHAEARSAMQIRQATKLDRLGANLPNAFAALLNEFDGAHWEETMELVRLGLGDHIESIKARVGPSGGSIALWVKLKGRDEPFPASSLSDGMLAFLAFVALFRLPRPERTLLAFDEPELHLHPELLVRVLDFFEELADSHPVLLATHSDRLLDALRDPSRTIRVCDIEAGSGATRIRKLEPEALDPWLADYRGVGDLRGAGYLPAVMKREGAA